MLGPIEKYKGTYLENMQDTLKYMPIEIQRNAELTARLDKRATLLAATVEEQCKRVLREAKEGREPDMAAMQSLRENQQELHRLQEEKVALAIQAQNIYRSYLERIDSDLASFEEELAADNEVPPDPFAAVQRPPKRSVAELVELNPNPNPNNDPREPRYCYCRQVSFGLMVGCENKNCKIEWFHGKCVGFDSQQNVPKIWYCDECAADLEKYNG